MVVGGTVVLALVGVVVARKCFPNLAEGPYDDIVDGLRVVYELVFALILAFVIGSVLGSFSAAESTVASEAALLAHMKRANDQLPVEQEVRLNSALNQYVHDIVETEWPSMRKGKASARASAGLETLYAVYARYDPPPTEVVESQFYSEAVGQLQAIGSARRDRLSASATEPPALLRVVIPLGVLLLLALEYRPKMALTGQLVHMGMLAVVVSFCYLLVIVMDYPFSGDVAVGNEPLRSGALAGFWASVEPHVLGQGEGSEKLSPKQLAGVWHSDNYGLMVFREVGDEMRAVYRLGNGSVVGQISADGVFRGWWCEEPTRQPHDFAGDVEWRLDKTSNGEFLFGNSRYGSEEPYTGDWDIEKVGGPEPPDLSPRFDQASAFCPHP